MTPPVRWETIALYSDGKIVARVRVPVRDHLPGVVLWGARYFRSDASSHGLYNESTFYFVPLQHMHAGPASPPAASIPKGK